MSNEKIKEITPKEQEKVSGGYITRKKGWLTDDIEVRSDKTGETIMSYTVGKIGAEHQEKALERAMEMDKKINHPNSPVGPKK